MFRQVYRIILVVCVVWLIQACRQSEGNLNRHPSAIHYSNHARCRMECRHIDENEVTEILHDGTINYNKSELDSADCRKRYALEGYSHNSQHLRIILASCNNIVTIITVIDLGTEWPCDCKWCSRRNLLVAFYVLCFVFKRVYLKNL